MSGPSSSLPGVSNGNGQEFRPSLRQRPFMTSRVVLTSRSESRGGGGDGGEVQLNTVKLCKKCENMMVGMSRESIHSTLAYSRCRCHRLFKYRKQAQVNTGSRPSVDETVPNLVGRLKSGNSMDRVIKLQPLHTRKTEDVARATTVKKKHTFPTSMRPLVSNPRVESSYNHGTARCIGTNDALSSGSVLPSLSAISLVSEKLPVGSVVEFSRTSITR